MKYSLFTVSVPEMTLEEAAKKMREYGYDGVDWRVLTFRQIQRF